MFELTEKIYYADDVILRKLETDFELIERNGWYILYKNKSDGSFWRLDEWDKYQEQFFVRLETIENWTNYDDEEMRISLLKKYRGTTNKLYVERL